MKHQNTILTALLIVLQLCSSLWALPTTAYEAEMVVTGWLKTNPQPLNTPLSQQIMGVENFTDDLGEPVYYIVYLEPSGFVIVAGDDLVEPIIGFADNGIYDPSLDNPLGALVTNDLNGRISAVRSTFRLLAMTPQTAISDTQKKWNLFISSAVTSEGGFGLMARNSISDVRVAPLMRSKWDQETACNRNCYNYYTPNHYPSGCVATAMAQLMRYHQYPIEPDDSVPNSFFERQSFTIAVNGNNETRSLKGGDGNGGPYKWNRMVLTPGCSTTSLQREAIGALCYDAGISLSTNYTANGSFSSLYKAKEELLSTFKYENAISGWNYDYLTQTPLNLGLRLSGMVNPNLDAGHPVILSLRRDGTNGGHSVLADGYGYNFLTSYYHLNMGWSGNHDAWYNLPAIDSNPSYNVIDECVYNIFTSDSGEIISGRITDAFGSPIRGAKVTATASGSILRPFEPITPFGPITPLEPPSPFDPFIVPSIDIESYSDETDDKGIYALKGLVSNTTYTLNANKTGYDFDAKVVTTGESSDGKSASGNRWGINFEADYTAPLLEGFETNNFRQFPWEREGDRNWTIISWEKNSGNYSAKAGSIGHDESTSLKVRLNCAAGDITFYSKTSSEGNCDYLKFYINGVEKRKWSGTNDWTEVSFPVTAGTRTFKWTYSKDGSVNRGSDTVWIDDITFPVVGGL